MTILFNGCSNTYGYGLAPGQLNYAQLVSKYFNEDFDNNAFPGRDNQDIFINTLLKIKNNSYSKVIIQWTFTTRIGINAFPNSNMGSVVSTHSHPDPNTWFPPKTLEVLGIDSSGLKNYQKYAILLAGEHKSWMDVFLYSDIISTYCAHKGITPIFIDLALDQEFTNLIQSKKYSITQLPNSVKTILNQQLASDETIQKYIDTFLQLYNPDLWANFTDPWVKHWIDKATDNSHPGPRSHQWMADQIISHLT